MAFAKIDYGNAIAKLWGTFSKDEAEAFFMRHANQCFGIRRSIMGFELLEYEEDALLPSPWGRLEGAVTMLKHSGATIVWDHNGEKIKSEFD